jgi:hypothetical protein
MAVQRHNQFALAQHVHAPPDGVVGDAVLGGQVPLRRQLRTRLPLAGPDARGDVIRYLGVAKLQRVGLERRTPGDLS